MEGKICNQALDDYNSSQRLLSYEFDDLVCSQALDQVEVNLKLKIESDALERKLEDEQMLLDVRIVESTGAEPKPIVVALKPNHIARGRC